MASYTLIDIHTAREILALYRDVQTSSLERLEPMSGGISNSNYRCVMTSGPDLLLKVSNDKAQQEMLEEMKILKALNGFSYLVSPMALEDGSFIYRHQNLHGCVYPFVQGRRFEPNNNDVFQVGKALAALHCFSASEAQSLREHGQVGNSLEAILEYAKSSEAISDYARFCHTMLDPKLIERWKESKLECGLIHGDLYADNLIFKDLELAALLDFEQAGWGILLQDVGICISSCCLSEGRIDLGLMDHLLEGYESVRPLPVSERDLVPFSVILGLLDIALWRIRRFDEGDLDVSRRGHYKELLQIAQHFSTAP